MKDIQKSVWQNKIDKGFNVTDVNLEFCYLYAEVAEAYEAYRKKTGTVGEELADAAIFLYGLAEMLGVDLNDEICKKVSINEKRQYKVIDGVLQRTGDENND